ncbi:MAG: DUF29 domain-containing protein [Candidatus Competibacteraceae bacterium]|nr:MAG: DUF29 domain-containing protein [Candidatus Competibacteraceae bacterium]
MTTVSYDSDFYAWAMEQANLLRAGKLNEIDTVNLIEEIESMGRSEKRELENRLVMLLQHLLKWQFQPSHQGRSWRLTIEEQRREIPYVIEDNPSLKNALDDIVQRAYAKATKAAASETDLPILTFPQKCPWSFDLAVRDDFFPN